MSNNNDHEMMSVLLDDEPPGTRTSAFLTRAADDQEFRETIKRYRMIGAGMKGEYLGIQHMDLAESVSKSLSDEPTILAPKRAAKKSPWVQPLVGGALAASVAAIAIVLGPQVLNNQMSVPEKVAPFADVPSFAAIPASAKETRWKTLGPEAESELNELLEDHSEQSSWSRNSGIMPYTNFVSYDGR